MAALAFGWVANGGRTRRDRALVPEMGAFAATDKMVD
jgi:hypothetical protein